MNLFVGCAFHYSFTSFLFRRVQFLICGFVKRRGEWRGLVIEGEEREIDKLSLFSFLADERALPQILSFFFKISDDDS